ncbi:MAG TPA: hypothetical protein VMH84_11320 [Xanthobacteraceae bacterium]|nr:hypothetical protein [Xanthobacteraceae bacterium]
MRALPSGLAVSLSFVTALVLAAVAIQKGLVTDDAVRLWAGATSAGTGDLSIGRIVAAYPTIPFLSTTLVALLTPDSTPAPIIVASAVFAAITGFWFVRFLTVGLPLWAAVLSTILIAFHPMMLRAVIGGPADVFLALFLFMIASALFDLRARSTTPEVMMVGLSLFALAFSHPIGAAIAFAMVPLLVLAVHPMLVANSSLNILIALLFPTIFGIFAFVYVSWIFPGAGWSYFAAPAESLSHWAVGIAHLIGDNLSGGLTVDASLATGAALVLGAPVAIVAFSWVIRRRPLIAPALVFASALIVAAASTVATGLFGDPSALAVASPVLAAIAMIRVPTVSQRLSVILPLLALGWIGGLISLALIDPATTTRLTALVESRGGDSERIDTLAAGGAMVGRDGILVDSQNAPAIVVGRGSARGVFAPSSEPFALALLLARLDAPFVAVPDPQSMIGISDRLNKAFPTLYREGAAGYRVIYQNMTWKMFERIPDKKD